MQFRRPSRRGHLGEGVAEGARAASGEFQPAASRSYFDGLVGPRGREAAARCLTLRPGAPVEELAVLLADLACSPGGALSRIVSRCLAPKERPLHENVGVDAVFPVPLVRCGSLPGRGRRRERAVRRWRRLGFVNVLLATWNLQFLGREGACTTCSSPIGRATTSTQLCSELCRGVPSRPGHDQRGTHNSRCSSAGMRAVRPQPPRLAPLVFAQGSLRGPVG